LIILAGVVLLDQATKLWAVSSLAGQPSVRVLGDFLMFTLVYNEGGAMGTRIGPSLYYLIMALAVLPFILYFIFRNRHTPAMSLPLAFIAGGATGNLIDRIRFGQVVDFIDVDFFNISIGSYQLDRFWTFNVADSAISCAIVFLLIHMFFQHKELRPSDPPPVQPGGTSDLAG
jgi:signal peptidase II